MKENNHSALKNEVVRLLEQNRNSFVSGGYIARTTGVSRQAVFKAVKTLCEEGYSISGAAGKGYKLDENCDILSADVITKNTGVKTFFYKTVGSTNLVALEKYANHGECIVIADSQSAGERKDGGDFLSPEQGVYVSYAITYQTNFSESDKIRGAVAQAALSCIKPLVPDAQICEVDEIRSDGKKICGVLVQLFCTAASGLSRFVVIGLGMYCNREDAPDGFKAVKLHDTRNSLISQIYSETKKRLTLLKNSF